MKAALIGAGGWGETHFRNWMRLASEGIVEFAGVCDVKPENLAMAKNAGIPVFLSDEELYRTVSPDVVSISAGIPYHLPLMRNALRYGASVLLEKPAAATADEVEQMIFLEQCHPAQFVRIAFQFLYAPETGMLKKEILKRGNLESVTVRGLVKRDDAYYSRNGWAGRLFDPGTGTAIYDSPLSNAFAHYLNLALYCTAPEPAGTSCVERLENVQLFRARPEIENFDVCSFSAYTRENIRMDVVFSHAVWETEYPNLRFHFSDGSEIHWTTDGWTDGTVFRRYQEDPQYSMFRYIAIPDKDSDSGCTLSAALEHTRCVEMIQHYPIKNTEAIRHSNYWEALCGIR